jgi:two-component system, NarL family, invasion response regulator UvrY
MKKTSIVVVDDHHVVRQGLKSIINAQPDFAVVAEAGSGKEALGKLREIPVDVLLLDLQLQDMSGLDVLRYTRSHYPLTKILMLSSYPESQFGFNVLRDGASGFIGKGTEPPELIRALRTVARGGKYVSHELAGQLVASLDGDKTGPRHSILSEREFQIFCKLAEGESVSQIAARLFLSVKTISTYRRRVLDKMSMNSNADITAYAMRNDLIR